MCAGAFKKCLEVGADASASVAEAAATGFLLIHPTCLCAQLEAAASSMHAILERLLSASSSLGLKQCRVVSSTDGAQRAHNSWAAAFAGGEAKSDVDTVDQAAAVSVASDINLRFINFGQQLQCALTSGMQ